MKFRYLIPALLSSLAFAQVGPFSQSPWALVDPFGLRIFPMQSLRGIVPEATVIVEGDYPPLFTEREIRFLEFRAGLLADLRKRLEEDVASPSQGAGAPVRYAGNAVPRMYPMGGLKWR
ncbi:MAG: hypothetical protein IPP78_00330 [Holophagaceae bacterium]|nr:hypothetical protein [Holophagaceae bacterium]